MLSIDAQLYLLSGGATLGMCYVAWQAFRLRKIYRSQSALIGAMTFLILGLKQAYGLYRLRALIAQARLRGVMIEHLTTEQWVVGVFWTYAIIIGFIWWMHWQHRDLRRLGMN